MVPSTEQVVELSANDLLDFVGRGSDRLAEIEARFAVRIVTRGNTLRILGQDPAEVQRAAQSIQTMIKLRAQSSHPARHQARLAIDAVAEDNTSDLFEAIGDRIQVSPRRRGVNPMTVAQKAYADAVRNHDITFAIGPAGTGKTYMAMALASSALNENKVRRIILVRPAVEAGERLGFLPGDIAAKFDPFVRPLYDAMYDMMDAERVKWLMDNGVVEIAPLAFMRGRTLNSSFIILDEGQNTTVEQMKMFLTRLGSDSKAIITGDITQVDLPQGRTSGLVHARRVLKGTPGIAFMEFSSKDVVRHPLVAKILDAYERDEQLRKAESNKHDSLTILDTTANTKPPDDGAANG
jgi:phosphate starvation-inducible PhoH-like protein